MNKNIIKNFVIGYKKNFSKYYNFEKLIILISIITNNNKKVIFLLNKISVNYRSERNIELEVFILNNVLNNSSIESNNFLVYKISEKLSLDLINYFNYDDHKIFIKLENIKYLNKSLMINIFNINHLKEINYIIYIINRVIEFVLKFNISINYVNNFFRKLKILSHDFKNINYLKSCDNIFNFLKSSNSNYIYLENCIEISYKIIHPHKQLNNFIVTYVDKNKILFKFTYDEINKIFSNTDNKFAKNPHNFQIFSISELKKINNQLTISHIKKLISNYIKILKYLKKKHILNYKIITGIDLESYKILLLFFRKLIIIENYLFQNNINNFEISNFENLTDLIMKNHKIMKVFENEKVMKIYNFITLIKNLSINGMCFLKTINMKEHIKLIKLIKESINNFN